MDVITKLSFYQTAYIIKVLLTMIFILIPIILIVKTTIDLGKATINPNELKKTPATIGRRFLTALIIFLIPTTLNNIIGMLTNERENSLINIYYDATPESIENLQKEVEKENAKTLNAKKAAEKDAYIVQGQMNDKLNELTEKTNDNDNNNNGNNNSNGNNSNDGNNENNGNNDNNNSNRNTPDATESQVDLSSENGTFGKVKVVNGVFYIPNQRATSDADTPRQSGKDGLNPIFWNRLNKLIQAAAAKGYKVTITSGLRPYSRQLQLWNNSSRPCSERSKWVACPGGSRHGWGIAADLKYSSSAASKWVHNNAASYGLTFRMSHEPWHIEPKQVKGGSYGSCKVSCK